MKKLTVPSHKELFIRRIQESILSGELKIGDKIPPERELAEGMGISRTVVNAGINTLVNQGFLTVVPRQGTFVADYRKDGTMETLNAILALKGDVLTNSDIRSILEIRWAVEHLTMKNAINKAGAEDLQKVKDIVKRLKDAGTPLEAAELCFEFQRELSIIGGNTMLTLIMASFKPPVLALWQRFARKYGIRVLYEHTLKSYEYVEMRDYDGAVKWLDLFMEDALDGEYTVYEE